MIHKIENKPILKAKILAVLLKLSNEKNDVDFKSDEINQLWSLDPRIEDYLWELNEIGAISYISIGEDGFAPILICSTNKSTIQHLLDCLAKIDGDTNLLDKRINDLLQHNPKRLITDIKESEAHIQNAKEQLAKNPLLEPLKKPLTDIENHFSSIKRVAENYDDIYKNIVKPVQDEGKSGVRATVFWAIISIIASWALTNIDSIKKLFATFG